MCSSELLLFDDDIIIILYVNVGLEIKDRKIGT